jgi:NADH:ubiquinone oxidoreductase subunit C
MTLETALQSAEILLAPWLDASERPQPHRIDVRLTADRLLPVVQALVDGQWGTLSAITGVDLGPPAEGEPGRIEVLYHFCEGPAIVSLRVTLPEDLALIPTVTGLIPSAILFEQELSEMLGVTVSDAPFSGHLFLPDDWPSAVYPLRKSFHSLEPVAGTALGG